MKFAKESETMELIMPDGSREILQRQISASGAKYGNEQITFWNKGNRARVFINDQIIFETENVETDSGVPAGIAASEDPEKKLFFKSTGFYVMLQKLEGKARVILAGEEFMLSGQDKDSTGYRYINDNICVKEEGKDLLIKTGSYEFRAESVNIDDYIENTELILKGLGQEPGWLMEVREEEIKLELDYAEVRITIAPANFTMEKKEEEIIYKVMTSLVNFQIQIIDREHSDIMSGKIFPFTVKITTGERELIGGAYIASNTQNRATYK